MNYVLSWRKKDNLEINLFQSNKTYSFLRDNPGVKWTSYVPLEDKPINYLEIGVFKGDNVVDISKSYCKHPESKMYCVDPWIDYKDYPEYKGKIQNIYTLFIENITKENITDKLIIHRDFSHNVVPSFEDEFFDIAFIDGNHETEYVYKDGVMTFPKVKSGGYLIFDDYGWIETKLGIDRFIDEHKSQFETVQITPLEQVIIKKL